MNLFTFVFLQWWKEERQGLWTQKTTVPITKQRSWVLQVPARQWPNFTKLRWHRQLWGWRWKKVPHIAIHTRGKSVVYVSCLWIILWKQEQVLFSHVLFVGGQFWWRRHQWWWSRSHEEIQKGSGVNFSHWQNDRGLERSLKEGTNTPPL